jgi:protein-S-isoprenylcysteine O-methyltransferase Ste14
MLSEIILALFILVCLIVFFILNLINFIKTKDRRLKAYAEIERPSGIAFELTVLGTFFFFLESFIYSFLVFTEHISLINLPLLKIQFEHDSYIQFLGIILTFFGYFIFLWSVFARGRYATAWEMPENHKLVTWGPYRYVRHPSYLAYFLMFFGLFFMLLNFLALLPLIAIPGYIKITEYEEKLLIKRFGEKYIEYQKKTGKFIPKIFSHNKS